MSLLAWFKEISDWFKDQVYKKANFSWLAEISTSRAPWKWGILPTVATMAMLLLAALSMAGTVWIGTAIWAGAFAKAAAFLPILSESVVWLLGVTAVNFWFSRDINRAILSTRDDSSTFVYSQKTNPTQLYRLVEHITAEVNEHFRQTLGDKHKPIPVPSIFTYNNNTKEIEISNFGRNPGKSGLFFPVEVFNFSANNLNQRKLAALVEKEVVKIYLNRGFFRTIVNMGTTLANTLNMLSTSDNLLFRAIGFLTGPIQYVLLLEKAINRSFEYEATGHVIQCFRGPDLSPAIDCGVNPFLEQPPTIAEIRAKKQEKQTRAPYTGFLSFIIRPFADWVDRNELEEYDKTGSRLLSALDVAVGEFIFYIRELNKQKPRATNEKVYIRPNVKDLVNQQISLANATTAQARVIADQHKEANRQLFDAIPADKRYDVIGPDGTGYVSPTIDAQERPIVAQAARGGAPILNQQQARARGRNAPNPAQESVASRHKMSLRKK